MLKKLSDSSSKISCVLVFNGVPREKNLHPEITFKSSYHKPMSVLTELYLNKTNLINKYYNVEYKSLSVNKLPFHHFPHHAFSIIKKPM